MFVQITLFLFMEQNTLGLSDTSFQDHPIAIKDQTRRNNFELEIWYSLNLDVGVTSLMPIVLPVKKEL
jgi:hypothetical protein